MSFDGSNSGFRHLSAADFSAEQVAGWCAAAGDGAESHEGSGAVDEWVVGYTNPRRESDVERELRRRSFSVYVPSMTVTKRRKDVLRPLLPRYAFIGLRPGQTFLGLEHTPGFEGLVRSGGETARVSADLVLGLKQLERDGVYDFSDCAKARAARCAKVAERERMLADLRAGHGALVQAGSYRSFTGRFDRQLDHEHVSILLKLFGREFPVPMALDHIEIVVLRK